MISSGFKLSLGLFVVASLVACGTPRPSTTSTTSADMAQTSESPASSKDVAAPEGELVCRARSNDGTSELYLKWTGGEASGVLRAIAPSGMVTDTRVTAARYKSRIIADDVSSTDLATHAAVIAEDNGKRRIRIEDMGQARWATCD
jgi:hypothetical protein